MPLNSTAETRPRRRTPEEREQIGRELLGVDSPMAQNNWIDPNQKPAHNTRPAPFVPYPKCKYHPSGEVKIVQDAAEEKKLGKGWEDRPFPPKEQ